MERMIEGESCLRVEEAAALLRTTRLRILMLLKEGSLEGVQEEGEWFVRKTSVERLAAEGAPAPKPSACQSSCTARKCGCKEE